ncbi:hypothetical protein V1477_003673 [Vespula maculifrons]|uniref:Uncharacterized protein n=1 Tax=Vespula maculifrons TaxID=7453 RepID=A0ABD2CTX0_VESMC
MAAFVERSSESFLHVVCRRRRCVASSTLSSSIKEEEEETEGDRGVRGEREGGVGIRVEEGGVGGTRGMGGYYTVVVSYVTLNTSSSSTWLLFAFIKEPPK